MTESPDEFVEEYCCVCERLTTHQIVDDDVFGEDALECLNCHTVWEAEIFDTE